MTEGAEVALSALRQTAQHQCAAAISRMSTLPLLANIVALAALVASILERRAPGAFPLHSLLVERFRKPKVGDLAVAAASGAAFVVVPLAIALFSGDGHVTFTPPSAWLPWIALAGAAAVAALGWAAIEELVFRGALLPIIGRRLPPWGAVIASAVVFAVAHLERQGRRAPTLMTLLDISLDGMAWGVAFLATRTLWVPTVWHAAKNLTVWLLVGGALRLAPPLMTVSTEAPRWYGSAGQAGILDVISTAIIAVAAAVVMWKRRGR